MAFKIDLTEFAEHVCDTCTYKITDDIEMTPATLNAMSDYMNAIVGEKTPTGMIATEACLEHLSEELRLLVIEKLRDRICDLYNNLEDDDKARLENDEVNEFEIEVEQDGN